LSDETIILPLDGSKTLVKTGVLEKIPTVKYGGVELWASATRVVDDVEQGLIDLQEELEAGLKPQRDGVLADLESGN
jgi:hypothetical protein